MNYTEIFDDMPWPRFEIKDLDGNVLLSCKAQKFALLPFLCADLRRADFRGRDLRLADFRDCDLSGADFTGANLENARLDRAVIDGTVFTGTNLKGTRVCGCDYRRAIDFDSSRVLEVSCDNSGIGIWK